ncbi:MAG: ABC transporter substrate-binding protein [Desulfovibrio sp.]|uniref:ABC transporter substrate-binding protein n=1 Tax=Desulfovibrio sp. 7SRBS1 TaxID=3378064 RepID=UPI003B3D5AEE
MLKSLHQRTSLFFLLLLTIVLSAQPAQARKITDMMGRRIEVPETIRTVYSLSPPETMLVYALDPTLLAGLNFPFRKQCKGFVSPQVMSLPVIGGYFGEGRTPNMEMLVKVHPDLVIGRKANALHEKMESFLDKFQIPIAYLVVDHLKQYPEAFEVTGKFLNRVERGEMLADYTRKTLATLDERLKTIPEKDRIRVYYAEGNDGLYTENSKSVHAEAINVAGGYNVHQAGTITRYGREKITMERVLQYQPEVILVEQPMFYRNIYTSPAWKNIPAVQNKRVYMIPKIPFNWLDRPPSFMRILGTKWLANILYPDLFHWDMTKETKEFFKVFLQTDIDDADVQRLLEAKQ